MAAVLRVAVDDCRGRSAYPRSKAGAYVAGTDRTWPFSFENLCDALGLDADALRAELIHAWDHLRVTSPLRSERSAASN